MKESLEETISRIVSGVGEGKTDPRIIGFTDYKSKYTVLKPKVAVEVELTEGKVIRIDVTDYFDFK